jgi:hypothetical protein
MIDGFALKVLHGTLTSIRITPPGLVHGKWNSWRKCDMYDYTGRPHGNMLVFRLFTDRPASNRMLPFNPGSEWEADMYRYATPCLLAKIPEPGE